MPATAVDLAAKIALEKATFDREQEAKKKASVEKKKQDATQDPLITYLTLKSNHHNSNLDRQYVESVFESYSVKTDPVESHQNLDQNQIVTRQNAWLGYEEIFKMWKIDLTED